MFSMEYQLAVMALLGGRMVNGSGLLPKYKNLNRKAYWVLMALYVMQCKGQRFICRNDLVAFLDKHINRVYPTDLSTILRRLAVEKYVSYTRVGNGNKSKMRVSILNRGRNAIEDLDYFLSCEFDRLKRPVAEG